MKNKKTLLLVLISSLTACLTLTFALPNSSQNKQETKLISQGVGTYNALKQDLVSESGEKILEVTKASYRTIENGLDSSSIQVRNLSGKNITALGIIWTVTFTDGKTCQIEQLINYRIHKDIVDAKAIRPFAPYEEKYIPRLTREIFDEGQAIGSVKVEFSFAEFEGSGGVGIEKSEMYKQLLAQREGAELYKRWVEDGYQNDSRNIGGVIKKLSGDELPNDKELENDKVKQGALIYKQWLLDTLKDRGADSLRELIGSK
jgi:hypothetical protein